MHGQRGPARAAAASLATRPKPPTAAASGQGGRRRSKPQRTANPLRANDLQPPPLVVVYAGTVPAPKLFC